MLVVGCLGVAVPAAGQSDDRSGTIRGTVLNENGEPVAGARVDARFFGKSVGMVVPMAQTGKDGRFLIAHLQMDEYSVSARKEEEGYPDMHWAFYSQGMPEHRVTLTPDAPEGETTIVLGPKAGMLTGQIVDAATGQPLPAGISMWRIGDPEHGMGSSLPSEYRVPIPSNVPVGVSIQLNGYETWRPSEALRLAPDEKMVVNVGLRGIWPLVDLVENPPHPGRQRSVTQAPGPGAKLPLEIRFESLTRNPDRLSEVLAQIQIANTGWTPYRLPVGGDGDLALQPANCGRREFRFALQTPYQQYPLLPGPTTFGSQDLPDSFLTIQPNASVRVRFKVDISRLLPLWKEGRAVGTPLHARCTDVEYDDNPQEYVVRQPSPEASSWNGFGVSLRPLH